MLHNSKLAYFKPSVILGGTRSGGVTRIEPGCPLVFVAYLNETTKGLLMLEILVYLLTFQSFTSGNILEIFNKSMWWPIVLFLQLHSRASSIYRIFSFVIVSNVAVLMYLTHQYFTSCIKLGRWNNKINYTNFQIWSRVTWEQLVCTSSGSYR